MFAELWEDLTSNALSLLLFGQRRHGVLGIRSVNEELTAHNDVYHEAYPIGKQDEIPSTSFSVVNILIRKGPQKIQCVGDDRLGPRVLQTVGFNYLQSTGVDKHGPIGRLEEVVRIGQAGSRARQRYNAA